MFFVIFNYWYIIYICGYKCGYTIDMATIKIMLHPINKDKNGRRSIVLRLTINRIKYFIDLGFEVRLLKDHFVEGQIKSSARVKNYKQINAIIIQKLSDAHQVLLELEKKNLPVTLESFKKGFQKQKSSDFVFSYFDEIISELDEKGKAGNASAYRTAKNSLKDFKSNTRLRFSDIDIIFLRKYEQHLKKKQIQGNSISNYMRTLRAVYNRAIGEDIADRLLYPFKNTFNPGGYQISDLETAPTKRAIKFDDLIKIKNYNTKELTSLHDAKMYFLFSFLARGMNFTDMALLRNENITGNRIFYARAKTRRKQTASIEILSPMKEILDYFKIHPAKADYIFPILSSDIHKSEIQKRDRIKSVLRRVNGKLKLIGEELEIDVPLTTYVTRHSWATIQKFEGESEALISEGLMHNNVETTQIYLKSFENAPLDEMNKRLVSKLF